MKLKIALLSVMFLCSSCTTMDSGTMAILTQRISNLENKTGEVTKATSDFIELTEDYSSKYIVWIKLSNTSDYPVEFKRQEDGRYKGPKGEYYTNKPTKTQVNTLYAF